MSADLAAWLLEQVAEDERLAKQAADVIPAAHGWYAIPQLAIADPEFAARYGFAYQHIAAQSPERVLAECAAKRAIVEEHAPECTRRAEWIKPDGPDFGCGTCHEAGGWADVHPEGYCPTLLAIAQPYAGRDGWRDEWVRVVPRS